MRLSGARRNGTDLGARRELFMFARTENPATAALRIATRDTDDDNLDHAYILTFGAADRDAGHNSFSRDSNDR
jgi:hypothetical protein